MIAPRASQNPQRIFVIWDFTVRTFHTVLTSLCDSPPAGVSVTALAVADAGGSILPDVVRAIASADAALVLTDRPNANVGFETGLALGLGKRVGLIYWGSRLPAWMGRSPGVNMLDRGVTSLGAIRTLLAERPD